MSRNAILDRVRARRGEPAPLPGLPGIAHGDPDRLLAQFTSVLERVGGTWTMRTLNDRLADVVRVRYPTAERIVCAEEGVMESTYPVGPDALPTDLVRVQLAVVRGRLGVAENAAVWIDDTQLPHRALPFVAEHLVLLLAPEAVVNDMHAAYAALGTPEAGFGVFVSGPSKTADIEQSLVMGAQGPRSLLVVLDATATDAPPAIPA